MNPSHSTSTSESQAATPRRQEFGFERTTCSCKKCSLWCEYVPGSLVPSDLDRLIPPGEDPILWAEQHLLASPALIQIIKQGATLYTPPSLGPRRQQNGHCHWLQNGRCSVHENSPYGCAFLGECGLTDAQANKVICGGREARAKAFQDDGLYAHIWKHLWDKGLREVSNIENNDRAIEALGRIKRAEDRIKLGEGRKNRRKEKKAARRWKGGGK